MTDPTAPDPGPMPYDVIRSIPASELASFGTELTPDQLEQLEQLEAALGADRRVAVLAWLREGAGNVASMLLASARQQAFWGLVAAAGAVVLGRLAERRPGPTEPVGANHPGRPEWEAGSGPGPARFAVGGDGTVEDLVDRTRGLLDDIETAFDGELDADSEQLLAKARAVLADDATDRDVEAGVQAALEALERYDPPAATPPAPEGACPVCEQLTGHQLGCPLDVAEA